MDGVELESPIRFLAPSNSLIVSSVGAETEVPPLPDLPKVLIGPCAEEEDGELANEKE